MAKKQPAPQPYAKPDQIQIRGNQIFSPLRQKWVALTPEERVRQEYLRRSDRRVWVFTRIRLTRRVPVTGRGQRRCPRRLPDLAHTRSQTKTGTRLDCD